MALARNAECPCSGRGSEMVTGMHTTFDGPPKFEVDRSDFARHGRLENLWSQAHDTVTSSAESCSCSWETIRVRRGKLKIYGFQVTDSSYLFSSFKHRPGLGNTVGILAVQGEGL
jgi:hypothetical protein